MGTDTGTRKGTGKRTGLARARAWLARARGGLAAGAVAAALLALACGATGSAATPAPRTAYAAAFLAACDGQGWFIDEVERLLGAGQGFGIVWAIADPTFATVTQNGFVTTKSKTGTVSLTAKQPSTGRSASVVLRIT